jgi:hypothetical protein
MPITADEGDREMTTKENNDKEKRIGVYGNEAEKCH